MIDPIKAIRGMHDIVPSEAGYWQTVETACQTIATNYGYRQIRLPIIEQTNLFKRTIGEATDIVEKEMYTFNDRDGDSLTLRPEGTAGCVRAGIEHALFYHQIQRLWYMGPMFRHERPQKGRYRQFHQFGVEAYGMPEPEIDAELILMGARLWKLLGIDHMVQLQINTLATKDVRLQYRNQLTEYFKAQEDQLDADSQRRLHTNPLRILDSKNVDMKSLLEQAPKLINVLDPTSEKYFARLCLLLDQFNIPYVINPTLVRGLDYYVHTVFEWVTDHLGAQGTICAGGRYDDLILQLGGQATPAVGFAAGIERLILLLKNVRQCDITPDIYVVLVGEVALTKGVALIEQLRDALPHQKIEIDLTGGSFKNQFKRADKSGANIAIIIGDEEIATEQLSVKNLREKEPQQRLTIQALINYLKERT